MDNLRDKFQNAREAAAENLRGAGDAARERLSGAGDSTRDRLGDAGDVAKQGLRNVKAAAQVKAAEVASQLSTVSEQPREMAEDAKTALGRMDKQEHVDMAVATAGIALDKWGPGIILRVPIKYGMRKAAEKGIMKATGKAHKTKGFARTSYSYQKSFRRHYAEVRAERKAGGDGPSLA